ncbi:RNA-directed DNA polymerase, eukaryota [Tanacetum coccineum]
MISHLFYADDAVFIGEWSQDNLIGIMHILRCFSLLSGLSINIKKSHLLSIGVPELLVLNLSAESPRLFGLSHYKKISINYLGIKVGGNMSMVNSWGDTVDKLKKRLSKWKLKSLSIGGRLTLLKSVLGSTPIYYMSLFKVPKAVLNQLEGMRCNFFNGIQDGERKIAWVKWSKVLASKKHGGLGVSSFYALNRALLTKWIWRFISKDNSLWGRVISTIHGPYTKKLTASHPSLWNSIIKEIQIILEPVILSNMEDRWVWDMNGDGVFRVKDVRNLLDDTLLPKDEFPTRWVKCVPIKINVFSWKIFLDRLPTRLNLYRRGVVITSVECPNCGEANEDTTHIFFNCGLALDVMHLVFRWWNLDRSSFSSYSDWLVWFKALRMGSKKKDVLEGVFYIAWWCIWSYRNHLLFADKKPRKDYIFDDVVLPQKRLARGSRLNYTEAVALIATQILEFVHDGDKSVAELMDIGRQLLGRRQVLPTVPHLLDSVQVEGTFPDGTNLITVHDPISSENGNLELALHGSFLPIPSLEKFPIIEGDKIPGELILRNGYVLLNSGREAVILKVTKDGDRPIQVNPCLIFDRRKAYGMRLNIPAGTATRFEPGDAKSVILVRIGGNEIADNFVNDANVKTMMESVNARGFGNSTDTSTTRISLAYRITREAYVNIYGPTVADKIRLGYSASDCLDTVITNSLIIDYTGIFKADIGIKGGCISAIEKAGKIVYLSRALYLCRLHNNKTIKVGEIFTFPRGLIHFQLNNEKVPAAVIAGFNFPGTQRIAKALFASSPIDEYVV